MAGNPPYSGKQSSANDNNQNLKYPMLDSRIEQTYAACSTATNKNNLYAPYSRALRWASVRIGDEGVIAFIPNSNFIDGNTADGVRLTLREEFSDIYVYNLRGAINGKIGDAAKREGGNVFNIKTSVAISVLLKTKNHNGSARIHYAEMVDRAKAQEKLDALNNSKSITGTVFNPITPNEHGDWINQRDDSYGEFQAIGDKKTKGKSNTPAIFQLYSGGLKTNRDSWCYNFSRTAVQEKMQRMIANYNAEVEAGRTPETANYEANYVSWGRES